MNNDGRPTMMNSAMNFGVMLGGFYIVKFCLQMLGLYSVMASLLFLGLALVLPLFAFGLVLRYRDQFCGGSIRFSHAFFFSMLAMSFGALLASVAYYIYFAFIDGGSVVEACMQSLEQMKGIDFSSVEGVNSDSLVLFNDLMGQAAQQLQAMSPVDMTLYLLSNNVWWGVILSLPIALVVSLSKLRK